VIKVSQILGLIGSLGSAILTSLIILEVRALRFLEGTGPLGRLATGLSTWSTLVFIFALVGIIGSAMLRWKTAAGIILMFIGGIGDFILVIIAINITGRLRGMELVEGILAVLLLVAAILAVVSISGNRPAKSQKSKV
jgi:hypothetical protein